MQVNKNMSLSLQPPREKHLPIFCFKQCQHCASWRDPKFEGEKCCLRGKNVLSENVFPPWHPDYLALLIKIPSFQAESRMLNNSSAFVSIGTACSDVHRNELTEKGWVRPSGIPQMYGLYGRTYHYVGAEQHKSTQFYMTGCDADSCFSPMCDASLKPHFLSLLTYFDTHNNLARLYKNVSHLPRGEKKAVWKRNRERADEPFVAFRSTDPEALPVRTFALHPKDGGVLYYSTMHRCGESGSYPIIFPSGNGGWYGEKIPGFGNAVTHPLYVSGSGVETVHQYVKYMLYQHGNRLTFL